MIGLKTAATALAALALSAGAATAQEWRTVAPENLLVIDTPKGRIVAELEPRIAPNHAARLRELADRGFYDGLKFHRVLVGFMAQTGDPNGDGSGGSDLPDVNAELEFRRGRDLPFAPVAEARPGLRGVVGSMPVLTQPDAQMMVTADFRVAAQAQFCPGVLGMARSNALNSANSQFFIMTGQNDVLNGAYTAFGRVLSGLDVVKALNAGAEANNGTVPFPDVMTRVRTAAALPEAERPTARVMEVRNPGFEATVEAARAARGARFSVCDVQPTAEVTGG